MGEHSNDIIMSIAETVSSTLERPIEDLPPLSEYINPEAIQTLISDDASENVTITFQYAGLRVLVRSGHTVYIRPLRKESDHSFERVSFER